MKKTKLLAAALLAVTMTASAGALAACNNTDEHKCGHVCPTCQKCTSDCTDEVCKDKCEGHGTTSATIDMTEGVYSQMMGTYELLIKFYANNVYYLQNETTGYRGKYEIKDEEITFSRTQADGTDYNTADHGAEARWETGNKVIYFYQEDGTTPIDYTLNSAEASAHDANTIVKGTCYAYGTKAHTLAYNTETDQIQSFKGAYGSRTLSHNKTSEFNVSKEKPIVQEKFMVKTLPDDVEAGKVESDYYLELTQKGCFTNIPALIALNINECVFEKTGENTYKLTDMATDTQATLTKTAAGASVTVGTTTVELVTWGDVTPYAVEVSGSAFGGKIQAKVRFNEDGTLIIYGTAKNYNGKYKATKDGTVTISDVDSDSPVTIDSASFNTVDDVTTLTANLIVKTGMENPATASVEATGTVSGKLYGLEAVALLEIDSDIQVSGMNLKLELKDNCTLTISVGGQSKVTAFWSLNATTRTISFKKASVGTFAYDWNSGAPKITWTGRLSAQESEDVTYTFSFAAQDLGKLTTAKVEEKYSTKVAVSKLGNKELTLTFLADGTITVTNPDMPSALATAEWTLTMNGQVPSITFESVSNGTMQGTLGSNYKVNWTGTITMGQNSVSVEVDWEFPSSDLGNLR